MSNARIRRKKVKRAAMLMAKIISYGDNMPDISATMRMAWNDRTVTIK